MESFWDNNYIVVDIETTGSDPVKNRIIEIACLVVQGGEIVDDFSSLVKPHQFIPNFISNMTGISNEMVFRAPESMEVMPQVIKYLQLPNAIFVAHNAKFDYSFVKETIFRDGLGVIDMPVLDTLKLARKILPKELKKNVGSLANHFRIPLVNRHRAFGDAEATSYILIELLEKIESEHSISTIDELLAFQNKSANNYKTIPQNIYNIRSQLESLPDEPGVYKFLSEKDEILYVGKAKSLKERVRTYFQTNEHASKKIADLIKNVEKIRYEVCESELAALIYESQEIKRLKPPFNSANKRYRSFPFIRIVKNEFPRIEKCYYIDDDDSEYFGPFRNRDLVDELIDRINKKFKLRKCVENLNPSSKFEPCIYHQMEMCDAPCALKQSKADYQIEVDKVRFFLSGFGNGIINQLENKMQDYATRLDFERAAVIRDQIKELRILLERKKNVNTSVNGNNVILIIPHSKREKNVEIFLIFGGKLKYYEILGRKAELDNLINKLDEVYLNNNSEVKNYSVQDVDELRIINSWLYKHKNIGKYIYTDGKDYQELFQDIRDAIKSFDYGDYTNEPIYFE